jgi:hypothetical protein
VKAQASQVGEAGDTAPGPPGVPGSAAGETAAHARIVRRLSSPAALWIAGLWALAEAALMVIVPDAWLGLVGLFAPRRVPAALAAIAAGAVVGAALLVGLTVLAPSGTTALLDALPGISVGDLERVRGELAADGLAAFVAGPIQGLPLKLYVHEATLAGLAGPLLFVFVVLNRLVRVGVFGLVLAIAGLVARPAVARWPRTVAIVYTIAWVIFYAAYFASRPG